MRSRIEKLEERQRWNGEVAAPVPVSLIAPRIVYKPSDVPSDEEERKRFFQSLYPENLPEGVPVFLIPDDGRN